jgi:hypothetical protein
MTRVEQVRIIAPNMLAKFISGGEILNEFEIQIFFKDRTCTRGKEAKSDDTNFEWSGGWKIGKRRAADNTKHKTVDLTIASLLVLQYRVYLPTSVKQNRISESSRWQCYSWRTTAYKRWQYRTYFRKHNKTKRRGKCGGREEVVGGKPTLLNVYVIRDGRGDPSYEDIAYSDGYTGKHNFCHAKTNLCFLCIFPRCI